MAWLVTSYPVYVIFVRAMTFPNYGFSVDLTLHSHGQRQLEVTPLYLFQDPANQYRKITCKILANNNKQMRDKLNGLAAKILELAPLLIGQMVDAVEAIQVTVGRMIHLLKRISKATRQQ